MPCLSSVPIKPPYGRLSQFYNADNGLSLSFRLEVLEQYEENILIWYCSEIRLFFLWKNKF